MRLFGRILAALLVAIPCWAASTTEVVLPAMTGFTTVTIPTANTLYCTTITAPFSISGATKIAAAVTSSSGSAQTCGFALYESGGGTQLGEISASCTAAIILTATVSSFSLTAGSRYELCHCRTATGVSATILTTIGTSASSNLFPGYNEQVAVRSYEATNACTTGNPPATTGGVGTPSTMPPATMTVE